MRLTVDDFGRLLFQSGVLLLCQSIFPLILGNKLLLAFWLSTARPELCRLTNHHETVFQAITSALVPNSLDTLHDLKVGIIKSLFRTVN